LEINVAFINGYGLIVLVGLLFILGFGGLTQIRREGLTTRFILESVGVTILAVAASLATAQPIHPLAFLIVIYLVVMRVRLTVDLANTLAQSGRGRWAMRLYGLASRLGPDPSGRVLIDINSAALLLNIGRAAEVTTTLERVLEQSDEIHLGFKHEAAARYNLGLAYLKQQRDSAAAEQFDAVINLWPGSRYAQRAQASLLERRPPSRDGAEQ
jgi:tetratricopeptide (TPR) repeat protein